MSSEVAAKKWFFSDEEISVIVNSFPEDNFGAALPIEQKVAFVQYVMSVHDEPKSKHPAAFYVLFARVVAEQYGSVCPEHYADPYAEEVVLEALNTLVGENPYQHEENLPTFKVIDAHKALAVCLCAKATSDFIDTKTYTHTHTYTYGY